MKDRTIASLKVNRRTFIRNASLVAATAGLTAGKSMPGLTGETRKHSQLVAEIELDLNHIHKWDDSNGDTWDPFWADDDGLYSFNCDGRGFGKTPENLAFNRLDGTVIEGLKGSQVNPMAEYGAAGKTGADKATWKACGQECIDGVFYAFVSRNVYGSISHDPWMRQTAFNSSLIKSEDRGKTWTRSAEDNYARPMWPGSSFGAPFFVHYGRNGGMSPFDRSEEYVYAVSTNGFWNDGDALVLGRVHRRSIAELDASHWEYFTGGNGLSDDAWSHQVSDARPILKSQTRCGQGPITFIPALGVYLLISWYNPTPLLKWFEPDEMKYDFYQAEHPWGPWKFIKSFSDRFLAAGSHMYGPALCPKYQQASGGQVTVALFTSGCQFEDQPAGIYKAWTYPVVLRTAALPPSRSVKYSDPAIIKRGEWTMLPSAAGRNDSALSSNGAEASLELSFPGTGIEYIARKAGGSGDVEIVIDGQPGTVVPLGTRNFPLLSGVSVFQRLNLTRQKHSFRLRSLGNGPVNLQSLTIYE